MTSLRALVVASLSIAFFLAGCECGAQSHVLSDSGVDTGFGFGEETGPLDSGCPPWCGAPDVGPDTAVTGNAYWTLEPATVDFFVNHQRCTETEGGTAILNVTAHYFESCLSPGPITATVDPATMTITVRAFVWRDHDADCMPIGAAFLREVPVRDLTAGTWHVDELHAGFDLIVDSPPPSACSGLVPLPEGSMCFGTCDCEAGLSCVAIEGDAVCASLCARPCGRVGGVGEAGLDCVSPQHECRAELLSGASVGTTCQPRSMDQCGPSTPCPEGMLCIADADAVSYCTWNIDLNSSTRVACATDADCVTPGLDCVHHPDGTARCEVRCTTESMRCPESAPHACNELGICEWLGE